MFIHHPLLKSSPPQGRGEVSVTKFPFLVKREVTNTIFVTFLKKTLALS